MVLAFWYLMASIPLAKNFTVGYPCTPFYPHKAACWVQSTSAIPTKLINKYLSNSCLNQQIEAKFLPSFCSVRTKGRRIWQKGNQISIEPYQMFTWSTYIELPACQTRVYYFVILLFIILFLTNSLFSLQALSSLTKLRLPILF